MLKLKLLLEGAYDYGCLMAFIDDDTSKKILDFNYSIIPENDLYKEGTEYGRECRPHVTIKFGFTKSYSEEKMNDFLKNIKPFKIKIKELSLFETDKYDVVKFDVISDELNKLHKRFSKLPNEDEHPEYHPHITLAYVKKGMGKKFIKKKKTFASIEIKTLQYSDKGEKTFYNLNEGITLRNYDAEIETLEKEWERLDSMGGQEWKQNHISNRLKKLRKDKEKWEKLYRPTL